MLSVVPPTERTFGDAAGYDRRPAVAPRKRARNDAGVPGRRLEGVLSKLVSPLNSPPPKLIETATTPGCRAAYWMATARSLNEELFASTRRIFAPGAIAWAHSTSREISLAQSALAAGKFVRLPVWLTFVKLGSGKLNLASKAFRSLAMFGSS